jgi:hypothetical protein
MSNNHRYSSYTLCAVAGVVIALGQDVRQRYLMQQLVFGLSVSKLSSHSFDFTNTSRFTWI